MLHLKSFVLSVLVCLILCLHITAAAQEPSAAPASGDNETTLHALLDEVRQLRLTLQRSQLSLYRAQITLERVRMQQERVDRLTQEMEGLNEQLNEIKLTQPRMAEMLKEVENQINLEQNINRRPELEAQHRMLKTETERQAQREQQQRERQVQLIGQLQAEQAKLAELNDKLEALEQELESQSAADKPKPSGRRR